MITNAGLTPLAYDVRDYSLAGVFGQIPLVEVPSTDFVVAQPLTIKDQGDTDYCSAYAVTSVSEDQEGTLLSPLYQFFKTKQISGNPEEWGADLRSACKVIVKYGSIPMSLVQNAPRLSREEVLDPKFWPQSIDEMAAPYKKSVFLDVSGRYDTFDNIRAALWQHKDEKRSIVVGAKWRMSWVDAPHGVIPSTYEDEGFGHAFKLFGQKVIDGKLYLMAQLSNGTSIGDGGIFYFPRDVVNKELKLYGQYMFKDLEKETVESLQTVPWYTTLINLIRNLLHV